VYRFQAVKSGPQWQAAGGGETKEMFEENIECPTSS
jgi:hypothetical protein